MDNGSLDVKNVRIVLQGLQKPANKSTGIQDLARVSLSCFKKQASFGEHWSAAHC